MGQYEELIQMMRTEGAKSNPEGIKLAVMTGPDSCKIGNLSLTREDLLFMDHLLIPRATEVIVPESHVDNSKYLPELRAGDQVALVRITATKYLILGRAVRT